MIVVRFVIRANKIAPANFSTLSKKASIDRTRGVSKPPTAKEIRFLDLLLAGV